MAARGMKVAKAKACPKRAATPGSAAEATVAPKAVAKAQPKAKAKAMRAPPMKKAGGCQQRKKGRGKKGPCRKACERGIFGCCFWLGDQAVSAGWIALRWVLPVLCVVYAGCQPDAELWYVTKGIMPLIGKPVLIAEASSILLSTIMVMVVTPAAAGGWLRRHFETVRSGAPMRRVYLPMEVGLCLWGPRISTCLFGGSLLWSFRRNTLHFETVGCQWATGGLFGCVARLIIPGPLATIVGHGSAGILWLFSAEVLGRGVARPFSEAGIEFFERILPSTLLLYTVRPQTVKVYLKALVEFLQWMAKNRVERVHTTEGLDDTLCRYIQEKFKEWEENVSGSTRQHCVNLRCCLILLRPRLCNRLQGSLKCLEGWKKLSPPTHYLPVPYGLTLLMITGFMKEGELETAILTWLCYHCLLRPGEGMALKVRDIVFPEQSHGDLTGSHSGGAIEEHENRSGSQG